MRTNTELHADVVRLLAPVTRDRYTYSGTGRTVERVNPEGIDLHDGRVGQVALAPDGRTVAHYMGLSVHPRADQHTRMGGGASRGTFGFSLTVAAGSRYGVLWALDRLDPVLGYARLDPSTSLLVPYFDQPEVIFDDDAAPPRWYVPLRYTCTAY